MARSGYLGSDLQPASLPDEQPAEPERRLELPEHEDAPDAHERVWNGAMRFLGRRPQGEQEAIDSLWENDPNDENMMDIAEMLQANPSLIAPFSGSRRTGVSGKPGAQPEFQYRPDRPY